MVIPEAYSRRIAAEVERRLRRKGSRVLLEEELPPEVASRVEEIVRQVEREGRWPMPADRKRSGAVGGETSSSSSPEGGPEEDQEEVIDGVLINKVAQGSGAALGCVLLGWHVWRELEMDECLRRLGFPRSYRLAAMALAINRLDRPVSEHAMPQWLGQCALPDLEPDLAGCRREDRFYRAGDKLLQHRAAIEEHLRRKQAEKLFLRRTLLLYDVTNTHFEGICAANPKARYGKNKQKRNDCPQAAIGIIFDENGVELAHRVFEGNRNDGTTLQELCTLARERRLPLIDEEPPIAVMDVGLATKENLEILREAGLDYLVNETRRNRRQWKAIFEQRDTFETIETRSGQIVHVRLEKLEDRDVRVFCRSASRTKNGRATTRRSPMPMSNAQSGRSRRR